MSQPADDQREREIEENHQKLVARIVAESDRRYTTEAERWAFRRGADWAFGKASAEVNEIFGLASKGKA